MEMPEPILQALDECHGQPLRLIDPRTNCHYLVVPADLFERIHYAEDGEGLDRRQVASLIANAMQEEDENDPALQSYQQRGEPE
jgi:hypothetical protein